MRNYCILNGVKSNTVNGLIIQELPPISKPLLRTSIEEIDGRDGDIVTPLGYSAYDKEMVIGLYGDYDIDDVIRYFSSSGTVIFSNEPDKYYNYQIIEQIDYERLARFRTATVTFHCQPFKYSAVEGSYSVLTDLLSIPDFSLTKNGITLTVEDGTISVSGSGTNPTEFYIPISLDLEAGEYAVNAKSLGTGADACTVRVIGHVPSNADAFGGSYMALEDSQTVTLQGEIESEKTFHYIWMYFKADTSMDFTIKLTMKAESLTVFNSGNADARPVIHIVGSGIVNLSLNGSLVLVMRISMESITIDAEEMQAYKGSIYLNRYVAGDYDALRLKSGTNVLSWTGDVERVSIRKFSRWI